MNVNGHIWRCCRTSTRDASRIWLLIARCVQLSIITAGLCLYSLESQSAINAALIADAFGVDEKRIAAPDRILVDYHASPDGRCLAGAATSRMGAPSRLFVGGAPSASWARID